MGQTEDRRGILFLVRFICETPHHDSLFDLLFLVPLPTSELLMILLFPIQQPDDFEILWCFLLHPEICCLPCLFLALLALRFVSAPSSSSHLCGICMSPLSCSVSSLSPTRFVSATKDNGTFVTNPPELCAIAVTVQLEIHV